MIRPENRPPMSLRAKAKAVILAAIALVVAWNFTAAVRYSVRPTFNSDFDPDAFHNVPAAEFAVDELGLAGPIPLQRTSPEETASGLKIALAGTFSSTTDTLIASFYIRERTATGWATGWVSFPVSGVKWVTGPQATIAFTFGDDKVKVPYVGHSYNYWRFLTFQGAESEHYLPGTDVGGETYNPAASILERATSVTVTLPKTGEWAQVRKEVGLK